MMKQTIYKAIMKECSEVADVLVSKYLHENVDTGEVTWDDDHEMLYTVDDMFGELGGYVYSILEDAVEDEPEE